MEAKAERRRARCKTLSRAMLKNREGHHSDDAVKKGCELRCEKIALCIAAFRVAALWCTKSTNILKIPAFFASSQPENSALVESAASTKILKIPAS